MYIFDSLIHNGGRLPVNMVYSPDNWQLILAGHSNVFANSKSRPAYLKDAQLDFSSYWVRALQELDEEALREQLGDVLDKRQIAALLKRRDGLLEDAGM